jgi:hypothetical protein
MRQDSAGVERAEGVRRVIIVACKNIRVAKLIVSSDKGKLKMIGEEAFAVSNKRCKASVAAKDNVTKKAQSSWLRRRERRVADRDMRQQAAVQLLFKQKLL